MDTQTDATTQKPTEQLPTFFFDPDCGFCTKMASLGTTLIPTVRYLAITQTTAQRYGFDIALAREAAPFVAPDGTISHGAAAIRALLAHGPFPYPALAKALGAPGLRQLGDVGYRVVAKNRHRLPGGTAACKLP